ncbi:MAG TPA: antibiotic biosynthesis monooxygenase [Verrucomicrobiae bacterium]|nr:antibiotic biosynthesis monooxygenase [Verrucomicrobiae bacterium]
MICRVWHGWTTEENAGAYSEFLLLELFPRVRDDLKGKGYRGYDLLQLKRASEVEFVTMLWFDSLSAIRSFAGELYELPVIHEKARKLLARYDSRCEHFEVLGSEREKFAI